MRWDADLDTDQDAERDGGDGMGPDDQRDRESSEAAGASTAEGELRCGGVHWPIGGRTLRLMLWLAVRQQRINEVASERGQLWITWKGSGPHSIDGEVKTRLSGE